MVRTDERSHTVADRAGVISGSRTKTAAEPLHKRIVLRFPKTTSGVITPFQRLPGRSIAHSNEIPIGSPQLQQRSEYRSLAVMRNTHTA
jgi:hypothetical protein